MNALAPIIAAEMTQVELFALRDQLDAIISAGATPMSGPSCLQYGAGSNAVTHKSGRRLYRHVALETLSYHRATPSDPHASPALIVAANALAKHLAAAMALSFPTEDA